MNVSNIKEKIRHRAKNSLHYPVIKDTKYKNKFFNINKNNESASPSKKRRNSQITLKIDNKKNNSLFTLSKASKVYSMKAFNYLFPYKKAAYNLLKKKYNCSYKSCVNIKLNKFEVISIYNTFLIQNLIENKKSKLFCQIKDVSIYSNNNENLYHNYTQSDAKIFLKYLLFCVYDKDRMTYNKNLSEKIDRDKIKSVSENIIQLLHKIYISTTENFNKSNKKEESKKSNKKNIHKNLSIHKYPFIFELSPFEVHNSIPNLLPAGTEMLHTLKEYIKKKLNQKLYQNKFYCKNVSEGMDSTIRFNKSTKDNKSNKSKTINNVSFSKIIFRKKNNTINYHHDDVRRIQNDIDTYDVERLIKNIIKRGQKLKKKDTIKSQKIKIKFHFNSSNNNVEKSYEKNQISQNSTTLSAMNREGHLSHRTNMINNSPLNYVTEIKNFFKNKLLANKLNLKKNNINNTNIKSNQSFLQNIVENPLYKNSLDKKSEQYHKKAIFIRNSIYNFRKILSLKEFLKLNNCLNNSFIQSDIKIYKPKKAVEYQNGMYIFTKKINMNVWEKGGEINTQTKTKDITEKVLNKLKLIKSKRANRLNKCYTFRKLVKYGDIYYQDL